MVAQVLLVVEVTLIQLEHSPRLGTIACQKHEFVGQVYMSGRETPKKLSTIAAWMLLLTFASLSEASGEAANTD